MFDQSEARSLDGLSKLTHNETQKHGKSRTRSKRCAFFEGDQQETLSIDEFEMRHGDEM